MRVEKVCIWERERGIASVFWDHLQNLMRQPQLVLQAGTRKALEKGLDEEKLSWKSPENYCVWALSQPHKKKTHKEADFSAIFNPLQRVWGPFSMLRDTTFDKLHFHANLFVPQLTPVWCLIFFSYGRFLIYFWVFGAEHRKSWEEFSIFEFEFEFESGDVSEMSKTVEPNGMWKLKLN